VLSELFAVLLELDFAFDELLVFARPIYFARSCMLEHNELILRHSDEHYNRNVIVGQLCKTPLRG